MRQFMLAADQPLPAAGDTVLLDAEESHHLLKVLRIRADRDLHLVDGRGHRLVGRCVGRRDRLAEVVIDRVAADPREGAAPRLRLACGVVKGRRWEWALEKAVECGAHAVVPLLTEHGVVEPGQGRRERWLGVLRSGLKQSGRCLLPELAEPLSLDRFLAGVADGPVAFGAVPEERSEAETPPALPGPDAGGARPDWITVAVGPEGGWTEAERRALTGAGAVALDLGPHVLRTETAAVAALVLAQRVRGAWLDAAGVPPPPNPA